MSLKLNQQFLRRVVKTEESGDDVELESTCLSG